MPESAYDRERKRMCEWCAKGLRLAGIGGQWHDNGELMIHWPRCTAPTLAELAEQQAARVRELERVMTALGCQIASVDDALKIVEAKNQLISELEAAIEAAPHGAGCSYREWLCSQNCGAIHSTNCNCWKSKVRTNAIYK